MAVVLVRELRKCVGKGSRRCGEVWKALERHLGRLTKYGMVRDIAKIAVELARLDFLALDGEWLRPVAVKVFSRPLYSDGQQLVIELYNATGLKAVVEVSSKGHVYAYINQVERDQVE